VTTEAVQASKRLLVVGGTSGIGREVARRHAEAGEQVVLTGRAAERAEKVAQEVGGSARGFALDLSRPESIADALADVGRLDHLVLAAIDRDANTAKDYDLAAATYLVTMKLIGYTEVVHAVLDRLSDDASVVVFGGLAKERPYPGSTTVSTVNGGVTGLVHSLAVELAPVRVNALHPGIVADSPFWAGKSEATERVRARTPTGRGVAMDDIVDAVDFLLSNRSVNGTDLYVDGGWLLQ
jgi:NAD(P)-dependent dehydrogenase (short-subunit alcohol dehydrogenase family)